MASFRVRTPGEYLRIVWRRRFYIAVPLIIVSATLGYVIYRLPNVYESSTLIIVDPPKVSSTYVQPVNQIDITSRLGMIRQQVTSRTGLQEIVEKFDLYHDLRRAGTPTELVLEEMRRHIDVNIRNTGAGANAFTISFRGSDPELVRAVTAELAARFIDTNSIKTNQDINATTDLIENRIADVRRRLEKIEAERTKYLLAHPDAIQGTDQSLLGQLNSLSVLMQSLRSSIDTLQNNILAAEQMRAALKAQEEEVPERSLAEAQTEGQLRAKRADLEGKLQQLRATYTEKHPEVKEVLAQLDGVNKEMEDLKTKAEQEKKAKLSAKRNSIQVANLDIQIATAKREHAQKQIDFNRTAGEYSSLQQRLRLAPVLSTEAKNIERDYETLKREYDGLVKQKEEAMFSAKVIKDFNGESFRMQDPAYTPEAPVFPKRGFLYPFSLLLGLVSGLVVAFAAEARSFFTIQDARDVAHYTRLPLLVTVPKLVTDGERRQRMLLRAARTLGVLLLMLVAIPLLVKVIQYSKVFNMFSGGY